MAANTLTYTPGTTFQSSMVGQQVIVRVYMHEDKSLFMVASGTLEAYGELVDKVSFYFKGVRDEMHFDPRYVYADVSVIN